MGASRLVRNPHADRTRVPPAGIPDPSFHASLPGFAPTPLRLAPTAAAALGVATVLVKDEGSRMGMPSFKILGASWATYRAVLRGSAACRDRGRRWTSSARRCARPTGS